MNHDLSNLTQDALRRIAQTADLRALDDIRVAILGKSGTLTGILKSLGALDPDARRALGAAVNEAKTSLTQALDDKRAALQAAALDAKLAQERIDISLPARPDAQGSIHPISRTIEELTAIFGAMGFTVKEGPDIEDDWYNFSALNIPSHHPARAMMDTF
ncbi:MAG TPA: phenylalanine--tRNA ligase subunit alpha, partial [Acetobacteraceae bacterium]|nr:phenylalanine--tRNA ligase subunit alpha [Acetobacteraceae bacterium]